MQGDGLAGRDAGTAGPGARQGVRPLRIRYRAPLRFDDEFDVCLSIAEMCTTAVRTEVTVERDGVIAAEGELRHVLIDPGSGEKTPIPDDVRGALERYVL
ncbi:MAG TPA: thioesterase family protein [Solirubrobacterales bacterium]|nr:thioesterase family protein [Solirubrobacterales bacterium]